PPPRRSTPPARPATRLIGREAQVASIHRLLAAERLVTVVGPGGVGKTRVVLEVARPGDAATMLSLAPVTAPAAIPHALASALNLSVTSGDVLAACVAVLGEDPGLLVIDNCEHLLDAVRDLVGVLLAGCPRLTILATSREPLGLAEEYTFRLSPLRLPRESTADDLARVPSVAVFLDRAGRVRPVEPADLRLVADIVRRLDGMPLAIELAAGRLSTFSLADLHARLDRSLDLLGGGRPAADARHRTLRATVEWSYRLLSADEQRLFRHLSVFVDGVDLATAERLAADLIPDDEPGRALSRLVDASMIDAEFTGDTRYRMLETLRAFGLDRLAAAGEDDAAATVLVRWAVELATGFEQAVATEREPSADALLRRELPNLRAAWRLTRDRGLHDDAVTLVTALFDAITYRDLVELRGWAVDLADDSSIAAHPRAAQVLGTAAEASYQSGDQVRAERFARAGLELATDTRGRWLCLMVRSVVALARGAYPEVVELSLAAMALSTTPRENLGIAALALAYGGDLDHARTLNRRGIDGALSPTMLAWGAYVGGEIDSLAGHPEQAERHYLRAIDLARASGATFLIGVATVGLHAVRATAGRVHDALHGYREAIDYFARTGNWTHQWTTLRNLANLLRRLDDHEPAAALDAAADRGLDASATDDGRTTPTPSRAAVLGLARDAIDRHLSAAVGSGAP
ncbi:MAG: ATP-binding protein, partial [Actinophytocola sp.]|uniref:ATP-binding protein n=1 Tax=Actinophytocola sp. TaxID=1872138 RepID=UPI003D6AE721